MYLRYFCSVQLPQSLLNSLQALKGFDEDAFINVHQLKEQITSVRLNPSKHGSALSFENNLSGPVPWSSHGFYLKERPSFTFDPLFHAGCYYVQEASSMFLEQALRQMLDVSTPLKVLDLCAAPGGKSTHIQSIISNESLLVSNEVIRSRANILKENIIKWGGSNVVVTNNDPKDFKNLNGYFDVIVIDAPCSGSGLFRRDEEAVQEWSESNVMLCCQRQQRIVADVLPALKEDGVLIYSTCSFSQEEDEEIVDWIADEFYLKSLRLKLDPKWRITETITKVQNYGYRFWPHKVKGEGFFISGFKKSSIEKTMTIKVKNAIEKASKKEIEVIAQWVTPEGLDFVKNGNTVYAWPRVHFESMQVLLSHLRVIYSGTLVGELMRDKLIPNHALAMSRIRNPEVPQTELALEQAIAFLQKKDISVDAERGWQLAAYDNQPLGWMNVLHNRTNNYYPKELRILKEKLP